MYALLGHDFSDFFQQGFHLVSGSSRQEIEGAIKRTLIEALTLRIKDWARKWQLQGQYPCGGSFGEIRLDPGDERGDFALVHLQVADQETQGRGLSGIGKLPEGLQAGGDGLEGSATLKKAGVAG